MDRNDTNNKRTRKKKYNNIITYEEYNRRVGELERIQVLGVEVIHDKNKIKIICGAVLVGVGIVTLPIPCGSMVLIAIGVSLMASGGIDMMARKRKLIQKIKYKFKRAFIW